MRCYKHNYVTDYGNCPHCESERHHAAVENQLASIRQDAQARENRQREVENAKRSAEAAREKAEALTALKLFLLEFLPRLKKQFGNEFIARNYTKLILVPGARIEDSVLEEFAEKILASDMSASERDVVALQKELHQSRDKALERYKSEFARFKEKFDSRRKIYFFTGSALITLGFLLYSIAKSDAFIIFRLFVWLFSAAAGAIFSIYLLLGLDRLINKEKSRDGWWPMASLALIRGVEGVTPWYSEEYNKSLEFIQAIGKGPALLINDIQGWKSTEDLTYLSRKIEDEIASLKSYKYAVPVTRESIKAVDINFDIRYPSREFIGLDGTDSFLICSTLGIFVGVCASPFTSGLLAFIAALATVVTTLYTLSRQKNKVYGEPSPVDEDLYYYGNASLQRGNVWVAGGLYLSKNSLVFSPIGLGANLFLSDIIKLKLDDAASAEISAGRPFQYGRFKVVMKAGEYTAFSVVNREKWVTAINELIGDHTKAAAPAISKAPETVNKATAQSSIGCLSCSFSDNPVIANFCRNCGKKLVKERLQ